MGNQPEAATYDATVYEYEIADPVEGGPGGIANAPLLNLANRTGWLKAQIAALFAAGYTTMAAVQAYARGTFQPLLGFEPVQQGGGVDQANNKVLLGWDGSFLRATIDTTDIGPLTANSFLAQLTIWETLLGGPGSVTLTAPPWAGRLWFQMVGGGGAGSNAEGSYTSGGGGGGGGMIEGMHVFTAGKGQQFGVVLGAGGAAGSQQAGGQATLYLGGNPLCYCSGGNGSYYTQAYLSAGGAGGGVVLGGLTYSSLAITGGYGEDGQLDPQTFKGGMGSPGPWGGQGRAGSGGGESAPGWGAGGGGAYGNANTSQPTLNGGAGGPAFFRSLWLPT